MKDLLLVNLRGNLQIIVQVLFFDDVAFRIFLSPKEVVNKKSCLCVICRLLRNILSSWELMHALNSLSNLNPMKDFIFSWVHT